MSTTLRSRRNRRNHPGAQPAQKLTRKSPHLTLSNEAPLDLSNSHSPDSVPAPMSNGESVGVTTPGPGNGDHQLALDALLNEAEHDQRPFPSVISDADDDSSQLTELDEDDNPTDPQSPANDEINDADSSEEDDDPQDTEAETERLEFSPRKLKEVANTSGIADRLRTAPLDVVSDEEEELDAENAVVTRAVADPADDSDGDSSLTDADEAIEDPGQFPSADTKKRKRSIYMAQDSDGQDVRSVKRRSASSIRGRMSLSDGLTASLKHRADSDLSEHAILAESDSEADVEERKSPENAEGADIADAGLAPKLDAGDDDVNGSDHDLSEPPDDLDQIAEAGAEVEAEAQEEDAAEEGVEEDDGEAAAKTEEELMRKKAAMDRMMDIEKCFAIFRDKLYDERLAALDEEKSRLEADVPEHADYLAMIRCLDQRRDEKIRIERASLRYKEETLKVKTVAERSILFGQYFQTVRAVREATMEQMNADFSQIQRERRQWKVKDPQFVYRFNPKRSQQIAQQTAYNKEVSLLSGIARHVGFPAAPEILGASHIDVENDLRAMRIRPQPSQYVAQVQSSARAEEALAARRFIEANAWANPNHPAHQHTFPSTEAAASQDVRNYATPLPDARRFTDLSQQANPPVPGSGSTIEAPGSGPPSGLGTKAMAQAVGPGSSPFDQYKPRPAKSPLVHAASAANGIPNNATRDAIRDEQTTDTYSRGMPINGMTGLGTPGPEVMSEQAMSGQRYAFSSPLDKMGSAAQGVVTESR